MVVRIFTKEQIREKQREKEQMSLEQEFKEVVNTKQQNRQILENTWHKLYLLQNYNITMSMFTGANLRWSSIITYLTHIRAIYKGYKYKDPLAKSLVDYVHNLMDSGVEPYPLPAGKKQREVSIEDLLKSNILTKYQLDYIFSSVGITKDLPDQSSAWTQNSSDKQFTETHHENYTNIVEEYSIPQNTTTNPIKKNPFSFKLKNNIPLTFFNPRKI